MIQVKKLIPEAQFSKATDGSAAYDMAAMSIVPTTDGQYIVGTGIAIAIPHGYVGLLAPRSSVIGRAAYLSNSVGVIDSDYRGEIRAVFRSLHGEAPYKVGERCCQLLIMPLASLVPEFVEELTNTTRGEGGFGSTGQA